MMDDDAPYISSSELYSEMLDSWDTLWNKKLGLYENIKNIVSQSTFLPNPGCIPLVTIYCLMPSKWAKIAGILFSCGDEGSGKSTIAKLANKIHGYKSTFSPADTFSSVRNALEGRKWVDEERTIEKEGVILCWDNIDAATFQREPRLYQLLLVGYDSSTSTMAIANQDGTNKFFDVFCPKIISSVQPLHFKSDFKELRRRMLVIPHKKLSRFTPYELSIQKLNFDERLDIDSVSWNGIEKEFHNFWNSLDNCRTYVSFRKLLSVKNTLKLPAIINADRWAISKDILCTGLTLKVWKDLNEAIDYIASYWHYCEDVIYKEGSATLEHLRQFIIDETEIQIRVNEALVADGRKPQKLKIASIRLKQKLESLQREGALDINPKLAEIQNIMNELGWRLTTEGWIER
jgi:hypothetical protein